MGRGRFGFGQARYGSAVKASPVKVGRVDVRFGMAVGVWWGEFRQGRLRFVVAVGA